MSPRRGRRPRPRGDGASLLQGALAPGRVRALADRAEADGVLDTPAGGVSVRVVGGVPGDRGVFRVIHTGKNATWVRPHELTAPSPVRVDAPCPVTHRCGGCPWQAVEPSAQRAARLALAQRATADVISRGAWRPWPHPAQATHYRTRALMALRHVGGRLRYGFFEARSHRLVPAEPCVVHHPLVEAALRAARDVLEARGLGTWRDAQRPGLLRGLLFRLDPGGGGGRGGDERSPTGLLTLIASRRDEALRAAARELVGQAGVAGVFVHLNDRPGGPLVGRGPTEHLAGAKTQRLRYGALTLEVGPVAFVQTHHAAAQALVESLAALAPATAGHLVDLYAGVGLMGLSLRARARSLTLVEASPAACADARANVARLGLGGRAQVVEGDAAAHAHALVASLGPGDLALLDPPRAGCGPAVLDALAASSLRRALYVSCQPRALGRDLRALASAGWRVEAAVPVDMFPHTPHLEVLASLARDATPAPADARRPEGI